MDHVEAGKMWEENAANWTKLARMGYDLYRDAVNTPAFFEMLPDVKGLAGLDIGCGGGYNTRLAARRGARMAAIDISPTFIRAAQAEEKERPLGIRYAAASAVELPFEGGAFDFAMATMSIMDVPDHEQAVREAYRVVSPGGFFQFSISHPCFVTPRWKWVRDGEGNKAAVECGDYFECRQDFVTQWIFGAAPQEAKAGMRKFRTPEFFRTLSSWMNIVVDAGFAIERMGEPCADEETARRQPYVADTRIVAYFLHVRCRKPRRD